MSDELEPRKIKPPSASFLRSGEGRLSQVPDEVSPLGAPAVEAIPDEELFGLPEVEPEPQQAQAREACSPGGSAPESSSSPLNLEERLRAEMRELRDIVQAQEPLSFLRSRVERALGETQVDPLLLVSFYRLVTRTLQESQEQIRRDYESMRSKASKLELELATHLVGPSPQSLLSGVASPEANERIARLELEVSQAQEQREKLLVDFKNMRERTQKDLDIKIFREKEGFFRRFLPVLESFDRAEQTLGVNSEVAVLLEGFRLISHQLQEALKAEGLSPIEAVGPFDPRLHEAVGEVENGEKPDQDIYDELARGYRLGERVIRPAMVRVSRNPGGFSSPESVENG